MSDTNETNETNERFIIGFSGRRGSGKDTCAKFINSLALVIGPNPITDKSYVNDKGDLIINTKEGERGFNLRPFDKESTRWMEDNVFPFIKVFAFADIMKDICINLFGLSRESAYGTNEEKDAPTHLLWERFPLDAWVDENGKVYVGKKKNKSHESKVGPMSGREVLQFVGTDLFRKMCPGVFVDALKRKIKYDDSMISLISDIRFADEIEMIQSIGGKVVRLTREPHRDENEHESEKALDDFPSDKFDFILENKDLTQNETFGILYEKLVEWGLVRSS